MKLSTLFAFVGVIFDVAVFPFSCGGNSRKNCYVFDARIIDEEKKIYSDIVVHGNLKKNFINLPENIITEQDDYFIDFWYLLYDEEKKEITFPYTYTDEDKVSYYTGYRSCVVFVAQWKLKEVVE